MMDLENEIRKLRNELEALRTRNWDRKKLRIINAHPSVDLYDYVVRKELLDLGGKVTRVAEEAGLVYFFDKLTFGFSIDSLLYVGNDLPPHYIVVSNLQLVKAYAKLKVAATGADVRIRINKNGTDNIFNSALVIPAGSSNVIQMSSGFAITNFSEGDFLTGDITQVGSSYAGQTLVVVLKFKVATNA